MRLWKVRAQDEIGYDLQGKDHKKLVFLESWRILFSGMHLTHVADIFDLQRKGITAHMLCAMGEDFSKEDVLSLEKAVRKDSFTYL